MRRIVSVASVLVLVLAACSPQSESEPEIAETTTTERPLPTSAPPLPPMELTSTAFEDGEEIPVRHTCDGSDVSPELNIKYVPPGTMTLAIIVDDPDAPVGVWDHWVEFDIPYEEGLDVTWAEDSGRLGTTGVNSWNVAGYRGPCPPEGQNHRYFFTVFALDTELLIPEGVNSDELRTGMFDHILSETQLMGTYSR